MKAQPPVDAPRPSSPSFEDVQVQWFARTGPFPAANPTPPPPPPSGMPPSMARSRFEREGDAIELADDDLDDDDEEADADAEADVDVALDSLVDPEELTASGERPSERTLLRESAHQTHQAHPTQHTQQTQPRREPTEHDEEFDTLVTSTRPWVRTRVWGSED